MLIKLKNDVTYPKKKLKQNWKGHEEYEEGYRECENLLKFFRVLIFNFS